MDFMLKLVDFMLTASSFLPVKNATSGSNFGSGLYASSFGNKTKTASFGNKNSIILR